jgi:general secretion pathway protein L
MTVLNQIKQYTRYVDWWFTTLKSCLPDKVSRRFNKYNQDVELLLTHRGDSVYLMDSSGRVIESTSMDSTSQPGDETDTGLDIDLGSGEEVEATQVSDIDATHIDLTEHSEVIHHEFNKKQNTDIEEQKFDDIDLTERNDTTIVFNRDDKTTRLLGLVSDDDTLVIKDDQGTLLNLDADSQTGGDSTVLYYSDRGRIRAIEARKDQSDGQEIDIDIGRLEDGSAQKEKTDNSSVEFYMAASLLEKHPGNKKCLYLIPEEKIFSLVLTYPAETLENIENVLRYDLEKHIPLSFQEIRFFYALNIKSATAKVDVEVIVIKSTVYDQLDSAFESESQREIICTTQHFYERYGTKINILGNRKGEPQSSLLSPGNIHVAINVCLLIAIFVLPYQMRYSELRSIQPKTAAEIAKAGEIVSTINNMNAEIQVSNKLSSLISKEHRMVELLSQLSESIGTDAWISRFNYQNGELKLKGEAASATSVSDDLNETGLFESIKFISSIIKNPTTKKETFELSLKVKSDA